MDAKTYKIVSSLLKKVQKVLENGEISGSIVNLPNLTTENMVPEAQEVLRKYEGLPNTSITRASLLKEVLNSLITVN